MDYVLGIDLGTSSLKGIVVNRQGEIVCIEKSDYPLKKIKSGYSEQDPHHWIKACENVFKKISEKKDIINRISGISFSGQMHSLVLLDKNNQVLRDSILWNDVRNTKQCDLIMTEFGKEILDITYNIALEGFTLPKILWVQENESDVWKQTNKILLPKDYLRYWLTNKFNMDFSDASGTLMLDLEKKEWSKKILNKFEIPIEYLPTLVDSSDYVGNVKKYIADKFNFRSDVKVFAGGADNACSAIGAGITNKKSHMISIGTSGVVLKYEDVPNEEYEGKLHVFHHAMNDSYYSMGVTLSAGYALSWYKNICSPDSEFNDFLEKISKVEAGSEGLFFTPYLIGERTPHMDSSIRGAFIGLDSNHTINHLTRSVVEGITYSLKEAQQIMKNKSLNVPQDMVLVGGGGKNSDWQQINADIFNSDIKTLESEEVAGLGAAIIAAVGLKWYTTFEDCILNFVKYKPKTKPIKNNVEKYGRFFPVYQSIYDKTKTISEEISNL